MTAADAREELEAAIWRTDPASLGAVRAVLAAADRYATAYAAGILEDIEEERRHVRGHRGVRDELIASRRAALIEGDGKHYWRTA